MKTSTIFFLPIALTALALSVNAAPPSQEVQGEALSLYKRSFLADQKCYNAPIPPWQSGCKPGWNFGKPCKGVKLPQWDGFDKAYCNWLSFVPILNKFSSLFCQGKLITKPIPPTCTTPTNPPKTTITQTTTTTSTTTATNIVTITTTTTASGTTSSSQSTTLPTQPSNPVCTGTGNTYQTVFTDYKTNATTGVYTGQIVGAATRDPPSYITYGMVDNVDGCFTMCDSVADCVFINTYHDVYDVDPTGQHDPSKLKCVLFKNCEDPAKANDNWGGQDDPNYITDSNGYCRSGNCPVST